MVSEEEPVNLSPFYESVEHANDGSRYSLVSAGLPSLLRMSFHRASSIETQESSSSSLLSTDDRRKRKSKLHAVASDPERFREFKQQLAKSTAGVHMFVHDYCTRDDLSPRVRFQAERQEASDSEEDEERAV